MSSTTDDVIHTYSRAQAVADGVLIGVPDHLAREAGWRLPVAFTAAAWADVVSWTPETEQRKPERTGQSATGRLCDVLWVAATAARRHPTAQRIPFRVLRVPVDGPSASPH
jgi:hypothetical protein